MVERPEQWTNTTNLLYSFSFSNMPVVRNPEIPLKIKKMHLEDGLSVKQITKALDVSRTFVLKKLHELSVHESQNKSRFSNPKNYQRSATPYGWKLKGQELVFNKREIKVCKKVVHLIRSGLSYTATAKELTKLKLKNRKGSTKWNHPIVINIYKRWKDKL